MTRSMNATCSVRLSVVRIAVVMLVFLSCQTSGFAQATKSSVDGASVDGPSVDGASVDGPSVDGASVDGPSVDGPSVDQAVPDWAVGDAFEKQLEKPIGITWQGVPLRDAITRLSAQSRVAIFLDRNIDPNVRLTLRSKNAGLEHVVRSLAERLGIGVARVGSVLYLGPHFTASRISTLVALRNDELARLPKGRAAVWRKHAPIHWPRLSEPRKIIEALADENGLQIVNTKRIPYDLWPAADLPELTVSERLSLLLVGFKLTYQFDKQNNVRLVSFPSSVAIERSYPISDLSIVAKLRDQFPQASFELTGDTLAARTTVDEHEEIRGLVVGDTSSSKPEPKVPRAVSLDDKRFQLRLVNQKFGNVIRQLIEQLDVELDVAPGAKVDLNQLITIDIKDATLDELMTAVVEPVGLRHERSGNKVILLPAESPQTPAESP